MSSTLRSGTTRDDLHGQTPAGRRARDPDGRKVESDKERIERSLGRGDETAYGRRAPIFVRDPTKYVAGHAFNARNVQGPIQSLHEQRGYDTESWFAPGIPYFSYRSN